jgi:hypothetical protein
MELYVIYYNSLATEGNASDNCVRRLLGYRAHVCSRGYPSTSVCRAWICFERRPQRLKRGKTDTAEPDIHFPAIPGAGPIHGMTPQYRSLSVSPMPTASSNDAGLIGFPQRSLCSRRARSPLSSRQRAACKRAGYTRNLRQSGRVAGAQPNPPQRDPTCWGIATHRLVDPDTAPVGGTDCRLSRSTCLAVWALRRNYLNTHTIHP